MLQRKIIRTPFSQVTLVDGVLRHLRVLKMECINDMLLLQLTKPLGEPKTVFYVRRQSARNKKKSMRTRKRSTASWEISNHGQSPFSINPYMDNP